MGDRLAGLLAASGAITKIEEDGSLAVTGADAMTIGKLAAAQDITLYELAPQQASLEEAFMDLTHDSADFRPGASRSGVRRTDAA